MYPGREEVKIRRFDTFLVRNGSPILKNMLGEMHRLPNGTDASEILPFPCESDNWEHLVSGADVPPSPRLFSAKGRADLTM